MADNPSDFARFLTILGRGPGRSRALTREEAHEALSLIFANQVDAYQVGAFLMLLRFRGEDPEEITGMVQAARAGLAPSLQADLDWPSYGAGRTRGAPWFLLAALALAQSGVRVLMHGSNDFSHGITVPVALAALGMAPCADARDAAHRLGVERFAYLPLAALSPGLDGLLGLRRLFGLRSPVNTVARLLDPGNAAAGVDGVFHPHYIDVHLGVAERLARPRLLVLKGGGGEVERVPLKDSAAYLWCQDEGRSEVPLPGVPGLAPLTPQSETPALVRAVWRGEAAPETVLATIHATIALALMALGGARPRRSRSGLADMPS